MDCCWSKKKLSRKRGNDGEANANDTVTKRMKADIETKKTLYDGTTQYNEDDSVVQNNSQNRCVIS